MSGLRIPVGSDAITIGYRSPTLRSSTPQEKMALAAELGLAVECQCAPHEIADLSAAEALAAAAREAGVVIPSVGCLMPLVEGEDLVGRCAFAIDVCHVLGCDYVFATVQNPEQRDEDQRQTWRRLVPRVREVCQRLGDAGISLAIEPDHGTFIHTCERLEDLLDAVDDDGLLANFDACNLYLGGSDPVRSVHRLAGRIRSGHIKDGRYRCGDWTECPLGTGEMDWAAVFAAMRAAGVACPMHIEHCSSSEQVRKARDHIASVIDGLD